METIVRGRPIHSRTLDVAATWREDGSWDARGEIVDLRKTGFVPIAGDLQMAGLLHHMQLRGVCDPASGALRELEVRQPAVAFEPSALTEGESCRDPGDRVAELVGEPLADSFPSRINAAIGGPRGCSHVLALARLLGSTLASALAREAERGGAPPWRPGERIVHRSLGLDGLEPREGRLELALQLTEVHFAPAPEVARPLERLAREREVRGTAELDLEELALQSLRVAERQRGPGELEKSDWNDLSERLVSLLDAPAASGTSGRILRLLGDRPPGDPSVDALLQLVPAGLQCLASRTEHWPATAVHSESRIVCAGPTDSCYMWREGGALDRLRRCEALEAD